MGLSRKEGMKKRGQQFDIRGTVEEFMREIGMYTSWKPGMDLTVTHVRREQVPSYVFEQGYKKACSTMHANEEEQFDKNDIEDGTGNTYLEGQLKRKYDSDGDGLEPLKSVKRASVSPPCEETPHDHGNSVGKLQCDSPVKLVSSVLCSETQTSLLHDDDVNLEQTHLTGSPDGSEDTSTSGTRCAVVGTLVVVDEPSKAGSLRLDADIDATQAMGLQTEKDETKVEGIISLASSSCAEFVERAEVFTRKVLADNVHLSGDEIL
jgi:poly(A) polymerase